RVLFRSRRSQARRRARIVVVFPVPAGPTSTSRTRPETPIFAIACSWSTDRVCPSRFFVLAASSIHASGTVGADRSFDAPRSRSSAASTCSEENTVPALGRNTLDPYARRNSQGHFASSDRKSGG